MTATAAPRPYRIPAGERLDRTLRGEAKRLEEALTQAAAGTGQRFEACGDDVIIYVACCTEVSLADLLATCVRADLQYIGASPAWAGRIVVSLVDYTVPVLILHPIINALEAL